MTASISHNLKVVGKRSKSEKECRSPRSRIQFQHPQCGLTARIRSLSYHVTSLWLFTYSDLKTIVGPSTVFGVISAISAPMFSISSTLSASETIQRTPLVLFWTWMNLLPFTISNQRQPASIEEDTLNKPWRSMPSKRLAMNQARNIMFMFYVLAAVTSRQVGGLAQCVVLVALGYWYNDLGGGDVSWVTRNFINACGYVSFSSGAMEVAIGGSLQWTPDLCLWFLVIGGVIFSTVQMMDMYDQAGDSLRSRKTFPLVMGDGLARWLTAFPIIIWSLFVSIFWNPHLDVTLCFIFLGVFIVWRTLNLRTPQEDKLTFKFWNIWIVGFYGLPFLKYVE